MSGDFPKKPVLGPEQPEKKVRLDETKAINLIWFAFSLSQGNNEQLRNIWLWLHANYPNYKITSGTKKIVLEKLFDPVKNKIFGTSGDHVRTTNSPKELQVDLERNIGIFMDTINNPRQELSTARESGIIDRMISSDRGYFLIQGRPGDPKKKDIWDSFFCRYILKTPPDRMHSSVPEYEHLLENLRNRFLNGYFETNPQVIQELVNWYNNYHPESTLVYSPKK